MPFPALIACQAFVEASRASFAPESPSGELVHARELGTSEADLLRCYPTLRAEDLANAWAYFRSHRQEIEQQIRENEAA